MAVTTKVKKVSKLKGKGKTSQVKLNNKNLNKKKKKSKGSKKKEKVQETHQENIEVDENESEEIPLQEEDFEYFGSDQPDLAAFVSKVKNSLGIKRKRKAEFDEEQSYEKAPRSNFEEKDTKVYKSLLPVKIKNKVIPQVREIEANKDSESEEDEDEEENEDLQTEEEERNISAAEQMYKQNQKLVETKRKMALIALSIIENPQEKFTGLRQLKHFLEEDTPELKVMIRKLGMVTLMEVFRDIIPSYKIRKLTEKELQQKTSKDTKALQTYEEALLVSYKHYLEYLWSVVSGLQRKNVDSDLSKNDYKVLKEVAIQCLCELLISCHHFNFRNELISFIVPCMNIFNKKGSQTACEMIKLVFQSDKLGATTLEIVKAIENFVKVKKMQVKPVMLDTFLSLKIKEIEMNPVAGKVQKEKEQQRLQRMSRSEKKREKQMSRLKRELLETEAAEDKKKKCEFNTSTIQHVFATYIRILKQNPNSCLLSSVLEGLAKFAHFINIDYFDDLFGVLNKLIASSELTAQQSLHCALTAFIILSGQGSVLNVDPAKFYKHVYANLTQIDAACTKRDITVVLECLEAMIFKRKKQLSKSRIMAFMKRLSTLGLHTLPEASIALLGVVRSIVHSFPSSDIMFESDYLSGSGVFLPELQDPEYCNASNTCLWELHLLKKHVCPTVSLFANHVIHQAPLTGAGQLPPHLAKLSAMDLHDKFSNDANNHWK